MAYKLDLPASSLLHPVFHVTVLKKNIGETEQAVEELPNFDEEGNMMLKPKEAIRYRQGRKTRNGERTWQVLVRWQGLPAEAATWEEYEELATTFPNLSLEDKGVLEGEGNDKIPPRRSTRIRDMTNHTATLEWLGLGEDYDGPKDQAMGLN